MSFHGDGDAKCQPGGEAPPAQTSRTVRLLYGLCLRSPLVQHRDTRLFYLPVQQAWLAPLYVHSLCYPKEIVLYHMWDMCSYSFSVQWAAEVRANWSLFWDQVLLRSPNIVALIYKKAVKTFSTAFHWEECEKPMEKPWGQFPCQREHYFLNEIISPVHCLIAAGRGEACAPAQRLALMVCGDGIKKSFTGLKTKPSPLTAP